MEKLQTNDKCEASYNGITLESSAGILKSQTLSNSRIA
jgi:hypothetical protein